MTKAQILSQAATSVAQANASAKLVSSSSRYWRSKEKTTFMNSSLDNWFSQIKKPLSYKTKLKQVVFYIFN